MRINYGINKTEKSKAHKRKRIIHENHHLEIDCESLEEYDKRRSEFFPKIMGMIINKHPGWAVSGFCPAETAPALTGLWFDEEV